MFRRTNAINKLLAMKARKKIVQGGTWAGPKRQNLRYYSSNH